MTLLVPRTTYKPFIYDRAFDFWMSQQNAHWIFTEVPMSSDIQDWKLYLTEEEKQVVGGTLKGFIQAEVVVNDYWTTKVKQWFQHPEIAAMASTFGSFECFDKETELLTDVGWKKVTEISMSDKIAQYNIDTKEITFVQPKKVVSYPYKGKMHYYKNRTTDICVTPNHDLILTHPSSRKVMKKKSCEGIWGRNYLYPNAGIGIGNSDTLTSTERLLIAIQADGCLRGMCPKSKRTHRTCDIGLTKDRKISRLENLLNESGIAYSKRVLPNNRTFFTFVTPGEMDISLIKGFEYVDYKSFSQKKAAAFIEELVFWDGDYKSGRFWYSSNKKAVDIVQIIATLANKSAKIQTVKRKTPNLLPNKLPPKSLKQAYCVIFCDQVERTYPNRQEVDYDDKVYCVSVDTQNLVSRRNGQVAMTGNTIHTFGYAYLNDSLGLLDYDAFLNEPTAKAKIDRLTELTKTNDNDPKTIARSLAIFSGFTEGVSLFSSFAILLNFSRFNKLKGVGQIISWSIKDESLHSEAGCWLFRQLVKENPEIWTDELKKDIYEAARTTVALEDDFIDKVFEKATVEGLETRDLKQFIRNRANVKLGDLGLKTNWKNVDQESLERMKWFDYLSSGTSKTDFFSQRETDYSKGTINWDLAFQQESEQQQG